VLTCLLPQHACTAANTCVHSACMQGVLCVGASLRPPVLSIFAYLCAVTLWLMLCAVLCCFHRWWARAWVLSLSARLQHALLAVRRCKA
jgi:hypothetical protein